MSDSILSPASPASFSWNSRVLVLVVAFLGWMFAGMNMTITQMVGRAAAIDFLRESGEIDKARFQELSAKIKAKIPLSSDENALWKGWESLAAPWFAWVNCSFLFGAATGGLVFGWVGDRLGRTKGLGLSVLTYSVLPLGVYYCESIEQLVVFWFIASMGMGGSWPNGVALVSEVWSGMSRPMVAGLMGSSANIGIFFLSTVAATYPVTPDHWRWIMLVGVSPLLLSVVAIRFVPESPRWLAARRSHTDDRPAAVSVAEVFRPPILGITLLGIALATIPLFGGWGSSNWMIPWADTGSNPLLKGEIQQYRSLVGIVGSLLGGWIASLAGRRRSYFLVSLCALLTAQYIFWFLVPSDRYFLFWVAVLGFFSGIYFGWLPLFLPELFPTRVRSTGSGVSFNFGRVVTAITLFVTGAMMDFFKRDYAQIGRLTSLIYALGMVVILFAPDTSKREMKD